MTDFYEDRMKVFFDTFQKFMTVSQERVDGFLYKKCGYKSDNTLPEIDDSFVEYDKLCIVAANPAVMSVFPVCLSILEIKTFSIH